MKTSTTTGRFEARDERTRRSVIALVVRDKTLAAAIAARLTAELGAVAILCSASDPAHLVPWLDENVADVLLLDERWLYRLDCGFPSLRVRWPNQSVLVVGDRACAALAEQVVRHRLQGFLLASRAADVCVKAVRAVKRGEMWIPRALLVELLLEHVRAAGQERGALNADTTLTRREAEVIGYVRRGFANKRIADALAIREDTVKKHLRNAYTKLGVHRRSEIITGHLLTE
jgi:DNA-binding NarL/FixJ family response regulator